MSYTKLWKVCQDYALGIAGVNDAKANLEALKTSWETEHGAVQPATGFALSLGDPYNAFGVHNTAPVPRAMVRVKPTTSGGIASQVFQDSVGGAVKSVARLSTGLWHIAMNNRLTLFFGDPRPAQSDNTVTRFCQPYGAIVFGASTGLVVGCYDLQAGDFVLTDFEFSCAVYSYA